MKILVFDIETTPNIAHVWRLFGEQHIGLEQLQAPTEVLCWAAKWLGEDEIMFAASWQRGGRAGMVRKMHKLLDEADAVVHFNGKHFDVPHMNREFALLGMWPPSPFKQIDLMLAVRKNFNFASNKLAHVAPQLGCEGKAETGGHELWVGVMAGNREAKRTMEEYNRQDVCVTEQVYGKLLPWLTGHPNRRLYDGGSGCPRCGGAHLQRRGFAFTQAGKFVKYQCMDCGTYHRETKRVHGDTLSEAVIN